MPSFPPLPELATGRDLDCEALRRLVAAIADRPELWAPLVTLDPTRRRFEQLRRDGHVDVWVISWMSGHDTGFHDHDVSRGAVAVVALSVIVERKARE